MNTIEQSLHDLSQKNKILLSVIEAQRIEIWALRRENEHLIRVQRRLQADVKTLMGYLGN